MSLVMQKGYVTNGQPIAGDTVYMVARSGKYMSRHSYSLKTYMICQI